MKHAALTILTSSSILVFAGLAVWQIASNGVISELGVLIARGAFTSMLMMFVFLPWLFKTFDGVIRRTSLGLHVYEGEPKGASALEGEGAQWRSDRKRDVRWRPRCWPARWRCRRRRWR